MKRGIFSIGYAGLVIVFALVAGRGAWATGPTATEADAKKTASTEAKTCTNAGVGNPTHSTTCYVTPGVSSDTKTSKTSVQDTNSNGGSVIDNQTFAHFHWADDYPQSAAPAIASYNGRVQGSYQYTFFLRRVHCDRYASFISSFGPGVFSTYDTKLYFFKDGNTNIIDVFDPISFIVTRYVDGPYARAEHPNDVKDGVYYSYKANTAKEIRLLDANGQLVTDPANAAKAVLKLYAGRELHFGIIDVSGATAVDLSNGLQLHLPLDETTGTTTADTSGNNRTGTVANYVSQVIQVDNISATVSGNWGTSNGVPGYQGTNYHYITTANADANTYLQYNPQLPTGSHQTRVYVTFPSYWTEVTIAPVTIHKADGTDTVVNVNQQVGGGLWHDLGSYELNENSYVRIGVDLNMGGGNLTVADAVKFVMTDTQTNESPVWAAGKNGNALTFDGADTQVAISGYGGIGTDQARSITAWIKTTGSGAIVGWGGTGSGQMFSLLVQGGQGGRPAGVLRCEINGGYITGDTAVNDGQWHHVALTFSPGDDSRVNHVQLYVDGVLQPVSSSLSQAVNTATASDLLVGNDPLNRYFAGSIDEVRVYNRALTDEEVSALVGQESDHVFAGRLIRNQERNGYGVTVTYQYNPGDDFLGSPARQWQINQITDDQGRAATFHYGTQQVAGRWAVSQVDLPNGQQVTYSYLNGLLSSVQHPGTNRASTFTRTYDATSGCTKVTFDDKTADPMHRHKTVYLSNNSQVLDDTGDVVPQPVGVARAVINGAGEVSYMSIPGFGTAYVYEGGGKLKRVFAGIQVQYATNWSFNDPNHINYDTIGFTGEPKYEQTPLSPSRNWYRAEPENKIDAAGRTKHYLYNSAGSLTQTTLPDATTEKYEYNQFEQVTRHEDRLGRVTRCTYDAQGNMLTQEVGLLMVNGVETAQPEHAVYQWEYYPQGDANQYLLKAAIDANGHQTDYEYDASHRLIKVIEPNDDGSPNNRPTTTCEYDTANRLWKQTDPQGRVTTFTYDDQNRLIKTTYADSSTELVIYGDPNDPSQPDDLIYKGKDRNGNAALYEYDDQDRLTRKVTAYSTMNADGTVETVITDPSIPVESTYTYVNGTNLVAQAVVAGEKTDYAYDYRQRLASTTVYPRTGKTLVATRTYVDNELFKTTDSYGYQSFFAYRDSDGQLIRNVLGLTPAFTLADEAAIVAQQRDLNPNAQYLITDTTRDAEGQIIQTTDPRNVTAIYSYDSRGRLVSNTVADGTAVAARTDMHYDDNSNVTEVDTPRYFDANDANGYQKARTTMTYTQRNLLVTRTVAPGTTETATESFGYNADRTINIHTDFRSNPWQTLWQTDNQRVLGQVDPAADVDGSGTNKRGATITLRDHYGNPTYLARVKDVNAVTDFHNPPADVTLSEVTTRYDPRNRPVARTVWLVPLPAVDENNVPIAGDVGYPTTDGLTTRWLYDNNLTDGSGLDNPTPAPGSVSIHRLLAELTADGITFTAGSQNGAAAVQINPEGELSVTIADGLGRAVITGVIAPVDDPTDPLKPLTWSTTLHDTMVTLTGRFSDGLGGTTNGGALETTTLDALNYTMKGHTDGAGRTIETIDAENNISSFAYDAQSNRLRSRDANSIGGDNTFDVRGRLTQFADTQEQVELTNRQFTYDAESNTLTTTDAKGLTQTSAYDARHRRVQHTDRINAITTYQYDASGNPTKIIDAQGGQTRYAYDPRNLRELAVYPEDDEFQSNGRRDRVDYAYDGAARPRKLTDQGSNTITWTHDLVGRMTTRGYPTGGNDTFTYDTDSRLLTATSARYNNLVTRTYDSVGRLASESLTVNTFSQTFTTQPGYNVRNEMTAITYPDGTVVNRDYTARYQLQQVRYLDSVGNNHTLAVRNYDAGGCLTGTTYESTLAETRGYTRLDNLITSINTTTVGGYAYTYDANKNRTAENVTGIMTNWGFTIPTGGHDNEDRLTNWQRNNGIDNQQWNLSFVADWTDTTINGSQEFRTHDDAHELTARGAQAITYDAKGNIAQQPHAGVAQNYTWDYDNKLSIADTTGDGNADVTYMFDALGRRVSKTTVPTGVAIVYVCLGDQEIAEYSFTPVATGTVGGVGISPTPKTITYTLALLRNYIYATYIDEPIAMVVPNPQPQAPSIYYYHQNAQFNVIALSDIAGNVVERYAYDAYGKPHIFDGNGLPRAASLYANAYLFTGRRYDTETALYYFRGRMYDAELGRFINRDPAEYPDGYNIYAGYFGMRMGADPSGLDYFQFRLKKQSSGDATKIRIYWQLYGVEETNWVGWWLNIPAGVEYGVASGTIEIDPKNEKTARTKIIQALSLQADLLTAQWVVGDLTNTRDQMIGISVQATMILAMPLVSKGATALAQTGTAGTVTVGAAQTYFTVQGVIQTYEMGNATIQSIQNGDSALNVIANGTQALNSGIQTSVGLYSLYGLFASQINTPQASQQTLGDMLSEYPNNAMIRMQDIDANIVPAGKYWARLGDVGNLTPTQYQGGVAGPGVPSSLTRTPQLLLFDSPTTQFQQVPSINIAGVPEYVNTRSVTATYSTTVSPPTYVSPPVPLVIIPPISPVPIPKPCN